MFDPVTLVSRKAGLPPGSLVHVGEKMTEKVKITMLNYDADHYELSEVDSPEACFPYKDRAAVTWINIDGLHDVSLIESIGNHFDIHPLIIEDILNTHQRPKTDMFEDNIYLVLKMHSFDIEAKQVDTEQLSIIFGENYVLTFQEKESDMFNQLRKRLEANKGRVRKLGADYLAYTIIDSVIDHYFKVIEGLGDEIEVIEDEVMTDPVPHTLHKIHILKTEILQLRKSVWPLREVISGLEREETALIKKTTKIYIRDLYDHTVQVIDTIETQRDIISGLLDVYLSSLSNRMNEIMKVLTLFAAIFIPLTFIAGIYGMNFNTANSPFNMPELNWYMGYPFALGLMTAVGIGLYLYFRKRNWF